MATDAERLDWLEKFGTERVQDVRWRMENEVCTVREAIDWFMEQEKKDRS